MKFNYLLICFLVFIFCSCTPQEDVDTWGPPEKQNPPACLIEKTSLQDEYYGLKLDELLFGGKILEKDIIIPINDNSYKAESLIGHGFSNMNIGDGTTLGFKRNDDSLALYDFKLFTMGYDDYYDCYEGVKVHEKLVEGVNLFCDEHQFTFELSYRVGTYDYECLDITGPLLKYYIAKPDIDSDDKIEVLYRSPIKKLSFGMVEFNVVVSINCKLYNRHGEYVGDLSDGILNFTYGGR